MIYDDIVVQFVDNGYDEDEANEMAAELCADMYNSP